MCFIEIRWKLSSHGDLRANDTLFYNRNKLLKFLEKVGVLKQKKLKFIYSIKVRYTLVC